MTVSSAACLEAVPESPFRTVLEFLEGQALEGGTFTGGQLAVSVGGGPLVAHSFGTDHLRRPFSDSALSCLYCAGKPLIVCGLLCLIQAGELSFDDQLGDIVPALPPWIGGRTIDQLLTHTAGLHELNLILGRLLPERSRYGWIRSAPTPSGWRPGVDVAYAAFASWYLLGMAIEEIAGVGYAEFVDEAVLRPYGVDPDSLIVRFNEVQFRRLRDRISVNLDLSGSRPVPLLGESGLSTCCEWNPSFGFYGSASGLMQFYAGLLADLQGAETVFSVDSIHSLFDLQSQTSFDDIIGRSASFGRGLMWPARLNGFGKLAGPGAFGHSGPGGTSFGFADPDASLVIAAVFNGLLDSETALALGRAPLIDRVYGALT